MVNSVTKPRKRMRVKETAGDRIFLVICYVFITFLGLACLYPFMNVVAKSFSAD